MASTIRSLRKLLSTILSDHWSHNNDTTSIIDPLLLGDLAWLRLRLGFLGMVLFGSARRLFVYEYIKPIVAGVYAREDISFRQLMRRITIARWSYIL